MHRFILIFLCMFIIPVALYAQDLTQEVLSEETQLTFQIPEDWETTFNTGGAAIVSLFGDEIELDIFTPYSLIYERIDENNEDPEALLSALIDNYGWDLQGFEAETINNRILTIATYQVDDFEGILVAVPLNNGQWAIVDTFSWDIDIDRDIVLEIASTIDWSPDSLTLTNYAGDWRDAIAELEENELILTGGDLVFVEDRAFFSGQGSFFTPLASNSPQTNFVMAATLDYTIGNEFTGEGELETCNLLARLQTDSTGTSQEFLEVGLDATGALYYYTADDSELTNYGEFRRLDLDKTYNVLFVANGPTMTLFLDGVEVSSNLPIDEIAGTFGIALRGTGPSASCVGENIWVYRIPQLQTGPCRVTSSTNVNKRTGPATTFDIGGQLTGGTTESVIGRSTGTDGFVWWQLEDENWVRNDVIELLGDCREVETIEP